MARQRTPTVFNEKILQFWQATSARLVAGQPSVSISGRRGHLINLRQQLYACRKQMVLAAHPLADSVSQICLRLDGPSDKEAENDLVFTLGIVPGGSAINDQIDSLIATTPASAPRAPNVRPIPSAPRAGVPGSADPAADDGADPDAGQHMAKTLEALGFRGRPANTNTDSKEDDSE